MALSMLIERWIAVAWLICGLSHVLYPRQWTELLWPLRDRPNGGFILALIGLPVGLIIVVGHNIWVWDVPVLVTIFGWVGTLKSAAYLLLPGAHTGVMRASERMAGHRPEIAFRIVGTAMAVLGAATAYHAFFRTPA